MIKEQIGNAILYLGDSLKVMKDIGTVSHIICDPPYENSIHESNKKLQQRKIKNGRIPFADFGFDSIDGIRDDFLDLVDAKGWFVAFCTAEGIARWADSINVRPNIKYKRPCIWVKPDGIPQFNGQMPGMGFECFVTAWCGEGRSAWNGGGKRGVYTHMIASHLKESNHSTEKPVSLMKELINDFTNQGDVILDPFMGSGTTGVAAVQMGRKFIGVEKMEEHFESACKRIEQAQRQGDFFL